MSNAIIEVNKLSKLYKLGEIGATSLRDSMSRVYDRLLKRENKLLNISSGDSDYLWALRDVSFKLEQGDRLGILGINGSGKSTLLKILSRITDPTSGYALIRGKVASFLEVGTGFHPELTGRDNIFLNGATLGMKRFEIQKRLDAIIAFSEVEQFIDTPIKRYSSGMIVRLAFSVAAHLEPDVLIVDEVLSVGDLAFRKKCMLKMQEISRGGKTILFVTHDLPSAQMLCNKGILLNKGQMAYEGDIQDVITHYLEQRKVIQLNNGDIDTVPRDGILGQAVKYYNFCILNSKNKRADKLLFREPFSICLGARSNIDINNVIFSVDIYNYSETLVTKLSNVCDDVYYSLKKDESFEVRLIPKNLNLSAGVYLITISIWSGAMLLDQVRNVSEVEVLKLPVGKEMHPSSGYGTVYIKGRWLSEKKKVS